jgi:uncharacterized membrane protein
MAARLIGWGEFFIAFVLFFLSHIIPVRPAIRDWLIRRIGKPIYLAVYSVLSIVLFGWLLVAADRAPYVAVWNFSPWQLWLPNIAMPIACLLLVFGAAGPNPLSIASSNNDAFEPDHPGIAGVTRHPVLWAAALWAIAHAVPNGDLAHILLFGLFGVFSLLGMLAIDARKRRVLGTAEWRRLSHNTSLVPLTAPVGGRWRPSFGETNRFRLAAATGLYVRLLTLHRLVIGVSPLPPY